MEVTIAQHLTKAKVMAVEVGNENISRQKVYAFYTRVKSFYFSYQGQIMGVTQAASRALWRSSREAGWWMVMTAIGDLVEIRRKYEICEINLQREIYQIQLTKLALFDAKNRGL